MSGKKAELPIENINYAIKLITDASELRRMAEEMTQQAKVLLRNAKVVDVVVTSEKKDDKIPE